MCDLALDEGGFRMNSHSVLAPVPHESDKAEAILGAALELFVDRGFHGTSVPSVAERAGVASGTIYHYFSSKEALVNALYTRWKGVVGAHILEAFPATAPMREQFRAVWMRMAEFAIAHPKELAFLEFHHHASYLDAESKATEQRIFDFGVQVVQMAQMAQALKAMPPALLMELANGAFLGVFRAGVAGRVPLTKETFLLAEQCCWEAVRA
jgi:TetR/AcrR family transcriptional regulator, repressor of fatR-cypB operon